VFYSVLKVLCLGFSLFFILKGIVKKKMAENMKRSSFEVLGMCCATEAALVERILKPLLGVKHVSVIVPTRTVTVVHDVLFISESQIGDFCTVFSSLFFG